MCPALDVVQGGSPIVVVAPHAGLRDHERRPWGSTRLRMNDVHTAAVASELALRLDASALVNAGTDRNDVDLNRVTVAHDRAPEFLASLAALVERALGRHGRAVVLLVHGWNVAQPAVDVGLGADPAVATAGGGASAVSPAFARTTLAGFAATLVRAGIAVTPGLRYPARSRENLLQLFTGRHGGDPRPALRRLAVLADRVDALQLELSLPLRLPGCWRDRFVDAAALAFTAPQRPAVHEWTTPARAATPAVAVQFVGLELSGFAAVDAQGGRLLLIRRDGRLVAFTGERVGRHASDGVAGLRIDGSDPRVIEVTYTGPMLAFPDTMPFLDLERGLTTAAVVEGRVAFTVCTLHDDAGAPCPFGVATGTARLGREALPIDGPGVRMEHRSAADGPHAALRLRDGVALLADGRDGVVCRNGMHRPIRHCAVRDAGEAVHVSALLDDGGTLDVHLDVLHRLPVVPGDPTARRAVFASCRHGDAPAGWIVVRASP